MTSAWLVAGAPALHSVAGGWQGTVARAALLLGMVAFLLLPRTSADPVARVVLRLAALGVGVMLVVGSGATPVSIPVILAVAGLGIGAGSLLIDGERQFYLLSRLADIVQGIALVWSQPLTLVGAGLIGLVRTGSLSE